MIPTLADTATTIQSTLEGWELSEGWAMFLAAVIHVSLVAGFFGLPAGIFIGDTLFPHSGGSPLLWQHLFWIFGHPEVYIIFLPSIALFAMLVPTFANRHLLGYPWIVLAAVGTAFLSFGLWVHHMFTTGLPKISLAFFSAASEAVAIPTGVQIFVFIATLWAGRVTWSTPLLYATGSLAIFVIGGLTGVMVAVAPFDWQAHDSYFIVAHLHYVLIGGTLMPLFAGLYYYWPLITGKKLSDRLGRIAFWMLFAGANLTFFPMHLSGLMGMPRRVYTQSHADYIVEVFEELAKRKDDIRGLKIVKEPPMMRHFTAEFAPL